MTANDPRDYTLSSIQAAERLGVSRDAIRSWAIDGRLPCLTTPGGFRRFREIDVDLFALSMLPNEATS